MILQITQLQIYYQITYLLVIRLGLLIENILSQPYFYLQRIFSPLILVHAILQPKLIDLLLSFLTFFNYGLYFLRPFHFFVSCAICRCILSFHLFFLATLPTPRPLIIFSSIFGAGYIYRAAIIFMLHQINFFPCDLGAFVLFTSQLFYFQ